MNNSQQKPERLTLRDSFNVMYFLASSHAACLTPFLRHSFGSEAPGLHGLGALVIILVYGGETRCAAMSDFLLLWIGALVIHRLRTFWLYGKGCRLHSHYGGYPWLAMRIPFLKSELQALAFEPVLCLVAGMLLCDQSQGLGKFVMAGALSLAIKHGIKRQAEQMRLRRMQDAFIEQEYLVERFRQNQKDF